MPVELPKRNNRGLPITLSIGALALSAIVTLAIQPKDDPAPSMKVVGVVAVRSADPTSTGSRVPDPLEIPKKKAKKKTTTVSSGGGGAATANVAAGVSSGSTSSGVTASGATANRTYTPPRSSGSSGSTSKKSSGSSGTSAAEAEFGPG